MRIETKMILPEIKRHLKQNCDRYTVLRLNQLRVTQLQMKELIRDNFSNIDLHSVDRFEQRCDTHGLRYTYFHVTTNMNRIR